MAVSPINYLRVGRKFHTAFNAMFCFVVFYLALLIFSVPLILLIVYRFFVSVILKRFYERKYKLAPSFSAFTGYDKAPSIMNLTFFVFISGSTDIDKLRERILTSLSAADSNGEIPYEVFLNAIVEKLGFFCFEDQRASFDINHHVRYCSEADNPERIYSEAEMFSAVEKGANREWDTSKPRWKILLVPKLREDSTNEVCSALAITIFHVYADGISFAQFVRNCVLDQPCPKLIIDPVRPPMNYVSLHRKLFVYLKTFFIGPYILLRHAGCSKEQLLHDDNLEGCKLMGRTKAKISVNIIKRIRKSFNCTTQAIFHSAFVGALKKVANRKQYRIPDEILAGISQVKLPYPNEFPQNRAVMSVELMKVGIKDPVVRLFVINQRILELSEQEVLMSCSFFIGLIGVLPAPMIKRVFSSTVKLAYYLSNVPGILNRANYNGKEVSSIFGIAPLINGMRCCIGVGTYDGAFCPAFVVEKSKLFESRTDLIELIDEFENEITYLENYCSSDYPK